MADTKLGTSGLALHDDKFTGIYRGKVLDNNDTSQLGRIKIQVYPMFADITDSTLLPWAVPAYSIVEGAGDDIGYFAVPDNNTFVFVFFEQGDIYQPVYFAEAPTATKGLPSDRTTSYPNRKVLKTSNGTIIYIDDLMNQIKVYHPMGSYIWFNSEGMITFYTTSDIKLISSVVKVTGNMDIDTGWTGTFTTQDGKTVTVNTGIITNVTPSTSTGIGESLFGALEFGLIEFSN